MAPIVELTHPDNVELVPGATQNWADLPDPAGSAALRGLVEAYAEGAASCLVVGPHDADLMALLAERVPRLTVILRSIVDAAAVGTAHPAARVLCGELADAAARAGTFDLVVALDDVTRAHSLEAGPTSWLDLARTVRAAVAPEGRLLLGVENELGLHRLALAENPFTRNDDGDWTPLATWDATRPRTRHQVEAALTGLGIEAEVLEAYPTFRRPSAFGVRLDDATGPLTDLLPALATRPGDEPAQGSSPVFLTRSLGLAGRLREACAGWVVVGGPPHPGEPRVVEWSRSGERVTWTASSTDEVTRTVGASCRTIRVDRPAVTLLARLVQACTENDLPAVRGLLGQWRVWLEAVAVDGTLPPEFADARFGNVLAGTEWAALSPGLGAAPLGEAEWTALGDFFDVVRAQGVRMPWPTNLHPRTVLETIGAMAGLEPPADVTPYLHPLEIDARYLLTRQELIATVRRQEEQLKGVWARYRWDEQKYLTDRLFRAAKRSARVAFSTRNRVVARVTGRTARQRAAAAEREAAEAQERAIRAEVDATAATRDEARP